MADRYLLESGAPDGYLLEDGTGVLLLEVDVPFRSNVTAEQSLPDDTARRNVVAFVVANLLTTTLAPVAVQLREPTFQSQHPPRQILVDSTRGSARLLLAGQAAPIGDSRLCASLPAPSNVSQPQDTSAGSPIGLLTAAPATPVFVAPFLAAPVNRTHPFDTSQGSPWPLLSAGAAPAPFAPRLFPLVQRPAWQPDDTSQGTPKPLYDDVSFAPAVMTEDLPGQQRRDIWPDTSRGSPLVLLGTPTAAPFTPEPQPHILHPRWQPFDTSNGTPLALATGPDTTQLRQPTFQLPKRIDWQPLDTTRGTFPALIPAATAPFTPAPHAYIDRIVWQPADTSRGTPATLLGSLVPFVGPLQPYVQESWQPLDASRGTFPGLFPAPQAPFVAPAQPYVQPSVWQALDTSRGTFPALIPPPAAPFVPNPWAPVPWASWQPLDASFGTPASLRAAPFVVYTHQPPLRATDVADTSHGANLPAQTFVQTPFAPVQSAAPVANVTQPLDTSQASPQPLLALLFVKPFAQTDWPAPIEWRHGALSQQTFFGQNPDGIPPAPPPPAATGENVFPWWAPQRPGKRPPRKRLETVAETIARVLADQQAKPLRAEALVLAAEAAALLDARKVASARVADLESRLDVLRAKRRRLAIAFLMLLH